MNHPRSAFSETRCATFRSTWASAFGPLRLFAPAECRHSEFGAAKAWAGRPQRATSAVGPAGRLTGLVRCGWRAVHLAPRALRAAHDAGESVHEARTACAPPPEPPQAGASHARCGLPAHAFAVTLWQCAARPRGAGEWLGVRVQRAVGGGEDRRAGGGARSAHPPLTRRRRAQRAKRAELSGRRAPRPRTAAKSARRADRRGRTDVPAPQAARARRCPHVGSPQTRQTAATGRMPTVMATTFHASRVARSAMDR